MLVSISRRQVQLSSTYICTSCLICRLPLHGQHVARHIASRQPFSTTSSAQKDEQDGEAGTAKSSESRQKKGGKKRPYLIPRASKAVAEAASKVQISHSKDELSALKRTLQDEETAAQFPTDPPTSSTTKQAAKKKNFLGKKTISMSVEHGETEAPTPKKPPTRSPPEKLSKKSHSNKHALTSASHTVPKKSKLESASLSNVASPSESASPLEVASPSEAASPALGESSEEVLEPDSITKTTKPSKKPSKKKPAKTMAIHEDPFDSGPASPSQELKPKSPKAKRLAKAPTEDQRRKVEALLSAVTPKLVESLSAQINSTIHQALAKMIGENKFLRAGNDGNKSSTFDAPEKVRRKGSSSKSGQVGRLNILRILSEGKPLVRKTRLSKGNQKPTVSRIVASHSLEEKSLKAAMQGQILGSEVPTPSPPRRSTPGDSVVTGPLTEGEGFEIQTLDASDLELVPVETVQPPVPSLWYGLERVLFNPGVYQLQDPRSRVFNFDPYLQKIMPVTEFDFEALKQYVTSSRDETLLSMAKQNLRKYTGSTSSMTAALAHFHFLLSQWRSVNTDSLSKNFPADLKSFTQITRSPSAVFLRWRDGVYAIDNDKQYDQSNILMNLGKSMEKLITIPTEDFEKYRKENSDKISLKDREGPEAFNYTTIGDFLLRSQLDAHDPRLPGEGMFDLKTRAVVSIRMHVEGYESGKDYEISSRLGDFESYEREYYDMMRAAFLKYSLQVRMGRMDGIFVAFHNTQRIFGFQYISKSEMDLALHGTEDTTTGDAEFKMSLELLNKVLDRATAKYPGKSLRLHFETRGTDVPFMYIFAEPMEDEKIDEIQQTNKAMIDKVEKQLLGLEGAEHLEDEMLTEEELSEKQKAAEWANMRAKVANNMEKDELDIEEAKALAETLLDENPYFESSELSTEEKEKVINKLLEAVTSNEDEEREDVLNSAVDSKRDEEGFEGASADSNEHEDDLVEEGADMVDEGETEVIDQEDAQEEAQEEDEFDEKEEGESNKTLDEAENSELAAQGETMEDLPVDTIAKTDHLASEFVAGEPERTDEQLDDIAEDASESVEGTQNESEATGEPVEDAEEVSGTDFDSADPERMETDVAGLVETEDLSSSEESATDDNESSSPLGDLAADTNGAIESYVPLAVEPQPDTTKELVAMTLTIRNKVNGEYVARPEKLTSEDKWTIEYALEDVPDAEQAQNLYIACQMRRTATHTRATQESGWLNSKYMKQLRALSEKGKIERAKQDLADAQRPVRVMGWDTVKGDVDRKNWAQNAAPSSTEP